MQLPKKLLLSLWVAIVKQTIAITIRGIVDRDAMAKKNA